LFRRAAGGDADQYNALMRMPMTEALPFVEDYFKELVRKVEEAKRMKAKK
jgi:hypothetical protein